MAKVNVDKAAAKRLLKMACPMFSRPKKVRGRIICRSILNERERAYLDELQARRTK